MFKILILFYFIFRFVCIFFKVSFMQTYNIHDSMLPLYCFLLECLFNTKQENIKKKIIFYILWRFDLIILIYFDLIWNECFLTLKSWNYHNTTAYANNLTEWATQIISKHVSWSFLIINIFASQYSIYWFIRSIEFLKRITNCVSSLRFHVHFWHSHIVMRYEWILWSHLCWF